MRDITGREDLDRPGGVLDLAAYLGALSPRELGGRRLLSDAAPAAVRRSADDRFDHVLYKLDKTNSYAVVVVALEPDDVLGHYVLDLGELYDSSGPSTPAV